MKNLKENFYRAYGLNICSSVVIPQLSSIKFNSGNSNSNVDVIIRLGNVKIPKNNILVEGNYFKTTKNSFYLFWEDFGKFKISNGNEIILDPIPNINEELFTYFIVGALMGALLYQRDYLILHASSVNINHKAVAFLGDSGSGKSTIAMSLQKRGFPIVTDEILAIKFDKSNEPYVYPSFPKVRLNYETMSKLSNESSNVFNEQHGLLKNFYNAQYRFSEKPLSLKSIYIVEKSIDTILKRLKPQRALIELIGNSFCIQMSDNSKKFSHFNNCSYLARNLPIYTLKMRKSFDSIPVVHSLLLKE